MEIIDDTDVHAIDVIHWTREMKGDTSGFRRSAAEIIWTVRLSYIIYIFLHSYIRHVYAELYTFDSSYL